MADLVPRRPGRLGAAPRDRRCCALGTRGSARWKLERANTDDRAPGEADDAARPGKTATGLYLARRRRRPRRLPRAARPVGRTPTAPPSYRGGNFAGGRPGAQGHPQTVHGICAGRRPSAPASRPRPAPHGGDPAIRYAHDPARAGHAGSQDPKTTPATARVIDMAGQTSPDRPRHPPVPTRTTTRRRCRCLCWCRAVQLPVPIRQRR